MPFVPAPEKDDWYYQGDSEYLHGYGLFTPKDIPTGQKILFGHPFAELQVTNPSPVIVFEKMFEKMATSEDATKNLILNLENGPDCPARPNEMLYLNNADKAALGYRPSREAVYECLLLKLHKEWQQGKKWKHYSLKDAVALVGIFQHNSLQLRDERTTRKWSGLFVRMARLNHACSPNFYASWDPALGQLVLHAIRGTKAGEELTMMYDDSLVFVGRNRRREALEQIYGFWCECPACDTDARPGLVHAVVSKKLAKSDVDRLRYQKVQPETQESLFKLASTLIGLLHSKLATSYEKLGRHNEAVDQFRRARDNAVACFGGSSYMAGDTQSRLQKAEEKIELASIVQDVDRLTARLNASEEEVRDYMASATGVASPGDWTYSLDLNWMDLDSMDLDWEV